jgi:hypothetical protein
VLWVVGGVVSRWMEGVVGWMDGRLPGLGDDDIVEGLALVAEAGEADFDYHCCRWVGRGWRGVEDRCNWQLALGMSLELKFRLLRPASAALRKCRETKV